MDDERRDIIMEEIRDALMIIAEALEKLAKCVDEQGRLKISEREYKYE